MTVKITEKLGEAAGLYSKVEEQIKKVELMGEGLAIPAINELRYAGCHFTRAWHYLNIDKRAESEKEIESAINHIKRAGYDCIEIGIIFQLEQFREFQEAHKDVVIVDAFPKYFEVCSFFDDVKESVVKCEKETRGEMWERMEIYLTQLINYSKEINILREELKKKKHAMVLSKRRFIMSWAIPALVTILIAIFQWEKFSNFLSLPTQATSQQLLPNSPPNTSTKTSLP